METSNNYYKKSKTSLLSTSPSSLQWKCDQKTWQCDSYPMQNLTERKIGQYYNNKNTCLLNCNPLTRILPNVVMNKMMKEYLPIDSFPNLGSTNKFFQNTLIIKQKTMEYHLLKITKDIENYVNHQLQTVKMYVEKELIKIAEKLNKEDTDTKYENENKSNANLLEDNNILEFNFDDFNNYLMENINNLNNILNGNINEAISLNILFEIFENLANDIRLIIEFGIILLAIGPKENDEILKQVLISFQKILHRFFEPLDSIAQKLFQDNEMYEFYILIIYLKFDLMNPNRIINGFYDGLEYDLKLKSDYRMDVPAEIYEMLNNYFIKFIVIYSITSIEKLIIPALSSSFNHENKLLSSLSPLSTLIILYIKQSIEENGGFKNFNNDELLELSYLLRLIFNLFIKENGNNRIINNNSNFNEIITSFIIFILSENKSTATIDFELLNNLILAMGYLNIVSCVDFILKPVFKYFGIWDDKNNIIDDNNLRKITKLQIRENIARFLILLFLLHQYILTDYIFIGPDPRSKFESIIPLFVKLDQIFSFITPKDSDYIDFSTIYMYQKYRLLYEVNQQLGADSVIKFHNDILPNVTKQMNDQYHSWSNLIDPKFIQRIEEIYYKNINHKRNLIQRAKKKIKKNAAKTRSSAKI